jgi:putative tryptophan/tyrosine transport system substrate-binding protein
MSEEVAPKRLELLHELLPKSKVFALLVNSADPAIAEPQTREALSAARALGIDLHVLNVSTEQDFDAVFTKVKGSEAGGP